MTLLLMKQHHILIQTLNHSTQSQKYYFDTTPFEPLDEDANITSCMKNNIITILDDDCDSITVPTPNGGNTAIVTISDDDGIIVPPPGSFNDNRQMRPSLSQFPKISLTMNPHDLCLDG